MQFETIRSQSLDDSKPGLEVSYITDNTCARCGKGVAQLTEYSFYTYDHARIFVCLVENCPVCNRVALREFTASWSDCRGNTLDLRKYNGFRYPSKMEGSLFSPNINELSPVFVSIYNQSEVAEDEGLNDICGMGYRKALEFLIKDFLIHQHPDESDRIAQMLLAPAINLLESSKLKILAQRSAWLGNDESHYVRKHQDYSVTDLKAFIVAAVAYIDAELYVEKAEAITPEGS